MKRLHIHANVENLAESIAFYNALFGAEPSKTKDDYAKWMLDDPYINFAISTYQPPISAHIVMAQQHAVTPNRKNHGCKIQTALHGRPIIQWKTLKASQARLKRLLKRRPTQVLAACLRPLRRKQAAAVKETLHRA